MPTTGARQFKPTPTTTPPPAGSTTPTDPTASGQYNPFGGAGDVVMPGPGAERNMMDMEGGIAVARQGAQGYTGGPLTLPGFSYTGAQHEFGGNPRLAQAAVAAGWTPQMFAAWLTQGYDAQVAHGAANRAATTGYDAGKWGTAAQIAAAKAAGGGAAVENPPLTTPPASGVSADQSFTPVPTQGSVTPNITPYVTGTPTPSTAPTPHPFSGTPPTISSALPATVPPAITPSSGTAGAAPIHPLSGTPAAMPPTPSPFGGTAPSISTSQPPPTAAGVPVPSTTKKPVPAVGQ